MKCRVCGVSGDLTPMTWTTNGAGRVYYRDVCSFCKRGTLPKIGYNYKLRLARQQAFTIKFRKEMENKW